jgi:hypothetical protein
MIVRASGKRGREENAMTAGMTIVKGVERVVPRERADVMVVRKVESGNLILKDFEVDGEHVIVKGIDSRGLRLRNLV